MHPHRSARLDALAAVVSVPPRRPLLRLALLSARLRGFALHGFAAQSRLLADVGVTSRQPVALGAEEAAHAPAQVPRAPRRARCWAVDALGFAGLHGEPPAETLDSVRGALADTSPLVRAYAANALVRLDVADPTPEIVSALVFALSCEAPDLRSEALDSLRRLGSGAAAAVPALTALVQDKDDPDGRARHAAEALAQMGAAGTKALLAAAAGDVATQARVFEAASFTPALRVALIPRALAALAAPEPRVRETAAWLLGRAGPGRANVAAALAGAIDDPDPQVVRAALHGLGRVGPEAKPALPRLLHLANHGDDSMRDAVMAAIGGLGPAAKDAIPALSRLLPKGSAGVLARIGPAAVPALAGALRHPDQKVRDEAAFALRYLGRDAAPAVAALIAALGDTSPSVRNGAAQTLGRIGPAAARAVPALIGRVQTETDSSALSWAIHALGEIGPAAKAAAPALQKALDKEDMRRETALALVRIGALDAGASALAAQLTAAPDGRFGDEDSLAALAGLGSRAATAVPALRAALDGATSPSEATIAWAEALVRIEASPAALAHLTGALGRPGLQLPAAAALTRLGKAGEAIAALRPLLRHRRPRERALAAVLLLRAMPSDAEAQKALQVALESADLNAQAEAGRVLMEAGTLPADMTPVLVALLSSDLEWARRGGASALGKQGATARSALPALRRLLFDENDGVREMALRTIAAVEER